MPRWNELFQGHGERKFSKPKPLFHTQFSPNEIIVAENKNVNFNKYVMLVKETRVQWILRNRKPRFSVDQKRNDLVKET